MKTFEIRFQIGRSRPGFAGSGRNFIAVMHCELTKGHRGACHGEATMHGYSGCTPQ